MRIMPVNGTIFEPEQSMGAPCLAARVCNATDTFVLLRAVENGPSVAMELTHLVDDFLAAPG